MIHVIYGIVYYTKNNSRGLKEATQSSNCQKEEKNDLHHIHSYEFQIFRWKFEVSSVTGTSIKWCAKFFITMGVKMMSMVRWDATDDGNDNDVSHSNRVYAFNNELPFHFSH